MGMYPDYYGDFYDYGYSDFGGAAADAAIGVLGVVLGVLVIVYLLMLAYTIVAYILGSLGMHTVAKRRGIHHPWLAWIPVANVWTLGSISDQYQYVAKGKIRNRRKVLLGLTVAAYALMIPFMISSFSATFGMIDMIESGNYTVAEAMAPMMTFLGLYLVFMAVAIVQTVFGYMAYYDLFVSSKPSSAVAFLVLGIFFNFLLPFFVFACRKHDQGMPPRKQQAPVQSVWQPVAEPALPAVDETSPVAEESDFEEPALAAPDEEDINE